MNSKIFSTIITSALLSASINTVFSDRAIANDSITGRGITVTIEAPEIQNTLLPDASQYYVIDFEEQNGTNAFSKTNNGTTYSYSNDLQIKDASQHGGAYSSKFIVQNQSELGEFLPSFKLNVSEDQKYFGFWWSAGDSYNRITFKNDGEEVATFSTANLVEFIENSGTVTTANYLGNPNYQGEETSHLTEPFSFVNVFFNDGSVYDEILINSLHGGAAFESDNHTFSATEQSIRGEVILNNAPIANDDNANTNIYGTVTIDVLANDIDPDGDSTTITSIDSIFGGNAIIENNQIVYTAGEIPGEFSLIYTVQDAYGKTDSGTVTVTVIAFPD